MTTETKKQMLADYVAEKDLKDLKQGFEAILSRITDPEIVEKHGALTRNDVLGVDFLIRSIRIIDTGNQ